MRETKAIAFKMAALFLFFCSNTLAQKVKVTNGITKKMTGYRYFFGRYKPDTFAITVNEKPMELGDTETFHLKDGKLEIRYDFEYNGYAKESNVVIYEIPTDITELTFTFNWKKKIVNQATGKKEKARIFIKGLEPAEIKVTKIVDDWQDKVRGRKSRRKKKEKSA